MASEDRLRTRIALEAARIMAEEGVDEHGWATKKAAARLGLSAHRNLPKTEEIEAALVQHHRLFGRSEQPLQLARLRKLALEAMRFLAEYSPVLVGGVWSGGAGKFSPVRLHLYPEAPEDVIRKLMDTHIPFEEKSHPVERDAGVLADQPALHFSVDGTRVELILLPSPWKGHALRKKGKLITGGNIKDVEKLLADGQTQITLT